MTIYLNGRQIESVGDKLLASLEEVWGCEFYQKACFRFVSKMTIEVKNSTAGKNDPSNGPPS